MQMFKENELVMYGSTGVCRVKKIGKPSFADSDDDRLYYLLEPIFQNGIIYAPVDNAKVPIRAIISAERAFELLENLEELEVKEYTGRSMQQLSQHYQSILENYSSVDLLALTKSIYIKEIVADRNNKHLGQIDKRYMKRAGDLVYGEFAIALDTDRDKVEKYIKNRLEKNILGNS